MLCPLLAEVSTQLANGERRKDLGMVLSLHSFLAVQPAWGPGWLAGVWPHYLVFCLTPTLVLTFWIQNFAFLQMPSSGLHLLLGFLLLDASCHVWVESENLPQHSVSVLLVYFSGSPFYSPPLNFLSDSGNLPRQSQPSLVAVQTPLFVLDLGHFVCYPDVPQTLLGPATKVLCWSPVLRQMLSERLNKGIRELGRWEK